MKKDVNNETLPTRKLTPLEAIEAATHKNAHYMSLIVETSLLLEGLEKAKDAEPAMQVALEKLADEAIVSLAQEMEKRHGVSA